MFKWLRGIIMGAKYRETFGENNLNADDFYTDRTKTSTLLCQKQLESF